MLCALYSLLSHRKVRESDQSRDSEADIGTETYHRAIFRLFLYYTHNPEVWALN